MTNRNFLKELFGMVLYKTSSGEYFYAWSAKNAIKKRPDRLLYMIDDFGNEIRIKTTEDKKL